MYCVIAREHFGTSSCFAAMFGITVAAFRSVAFVVLFFFFSSRRRHTRSVSGIPAEPLFRSMIIPMLCVTIFVILVVWFLLPRVARLMIHTPTAISIFVCLSMVQLMAVFISMRCTLCGHFLQVALTLILVVGYAIAAS